MMNPLTIIDKYYNEDAALRRILIVHSKAVADKALALARLNPSLNLDEEFIYEAAMLHDIGIIRCDAPGILCHGTAPYICHGMMGAEMLRSEGLPRHARVCERHTGAGITAEEIRQQQLPLPERDFLPETLEECLICYADKFFSKTRLEREKTTDQAIHSLEKFGTAGVARFLKWKEMFEP